MSVPGLKSRWVSEPFRIGSREEFARLREAFDALGYTEQALCERLGITTIYDVVDILEHGPLVQEVSDPQAVLARLFLEGRPAPRSRVRALLTPGDLEVIEGLGLLMPESVTGDNCVATVALYPMEGLFVASDRALDPEDLETPPPSDLVYAAFGRGTQRFLRLMPRAPCSDFLELCSGTGIAALLAASRFAERAWAVDITERSTRFAGFNAALNDIANASSLEGDLYAPVAGLTFDRIVAHPPYMPALDDEYVYRDGGEDGERVTWRILAGLAGHLRPGGQFFCQCLAGDRRNAPVEQRVRAALGDEGADFDVMVIEASTIDPTVYFARRASEERESFASVERRVGVFKRLGVERLVTGQILIRRRAPDADYPAVTVRRQLSQLTEAADFQWALDWHAATAGWDATAVGRLLRSRPRANPRAEVRTVHRLHDGRWTLDSCFLSTAVPFSVDATCPSWYAVLFTSCDGLLTAREQLERLKETGLVPDDAPEEQFAEMIRYLVECGLLEIEEFPHSARRPAR